MKKVYLLASVLFVTLAASAQLSIGVKAGLNHSNFRGQDIEGNKAKIGFHLGAYGDYVLGNGLSLAPELLFSTQGAKAEMGSDDEENPFEGKAKFNTSYILLPLLLKYTFQGGFYATAGVQPGVLLSAKFDVGEDKIDVKEGLNSFDLSIPVGIGYQSNSNFGVSLRYNLGLSKLSKEGDAKVYNGVAQLSLTYRLFQKGL